MNQRLRFQLSGRVQGVGFRPYVWRVVKQYSLSGFVKNTGEGVLIEVQGEKARVDQFRRSLRFGLPPLAKIEQIQETELKCERSSKTFEILPSEGLATYAQIPADSATCPACLKELFDTSNHRYRYPFINCTDCGPRYSITHHLPYDRANTSMEDFKLCSSCAYEYQDPCNRRFHAEPNACPACGPKLSLVDRFGKLLKGDAISGAIQILKMGRVVVVKGIGGFHLFADATQAAAVQRVRDVKQRPAKPLAIMAMNLASVKEFCKVSDAEAELLTSVSRPIVLLEKKPQADVMFAGVADHLKHIGVMLPYTPIHWLMFHEQMGRPSGEAWQDEVLRKAWVVTSGNAHGHSMVTQNEEAFKTLNQMADAMLVHNRDIIARADDSVMRVLDHQPMMIRRSRGAAPEPILLKNSGPDVLALGASLKSTICLLRGHQAIFSPHIGDLDQERNCRDFEASVHHFIELTGIKPEAIACDFDPDIYASQFAEVLASQLKVPVIQVQHHHAHIASVIAEKQLDQAVIGLALDGFGLGQDGQIWGGELLKVDSKGYQRIGHLKSIPLAGGRRSAKEPWRLAAGLLYVISEEAEAERRFGDKAAWAGVKGQLASEFTCQRTTSLGRWFDAVAGLAGVCESEQYYDAEAPMRLEALVSDMAPQGQDWEIHPDGELDFLPLIRKIIQAKHPSEIANLWHSQLVDALTHWAIKAAKKHDIQTVVLSGGCLQNQTMTEHLVSRLKAAGLKPVLSTMTPSNDGGVALGQAWVARQQLINFYSK